MDTLNYRKAEAMDTAAIRELSLLSYGQFATVLAPEHWEKMKHSMTDEAILQSLLDTGVTFVCAAGDQLAGVVHLLPSGSPSPIYPAHWATIRRLGVHPDFRGKGIGRRLVNMCIETARKQGEQVLGLHTSTIMPDARHIYDKAGFTLVREIEPLLGQQYWLYQLDL